jgi:hypothetical protein
MLDVKNKVKQREGERDRERQGRGGGRIPFSRNIISSHKDL